MHFNAFSPADYLDQLTEQEKERFFSFTNVNRQREFVATRILRHRLFGFQHIHYDEHGAPYIEDEGFISISHAPSTVGIALSKDFKIESFNLLPISNKMIDMQKPISKSPFYGFSIRSAATKKSSVSIKTLKKPLSRFSRISLTLMISQPSSN